MLLQPFDHGVDRFLLAQAVEEAGVNVHAVLSECLLLNVSAFQHRDDLQAEFLGEFIVAGIMRRHGHDGAGPVAGQHIVRDPDRHFFSIN